jgi:hypothetical protein
MRLREVPAKSMWARRGEMKERAARTKRVAVLAAGLLWAALLVALAIVEAISTGAELPPPPGMSAPWADHLVALTEAQAAQDQRMAGLAYQEAYSSAVASQRWEGMADVGDAALHLGDVRRARIAYLTAAYRARNDRSAVGVLRAVDGFSELGDRRVATHWLHVARKMAGANSVERARVGVAARRLADPAWEAHPSIEEVMP